MLTRPGFGLSVGFDGARAFRYWVAGRPCTDTVGGVYRGVLTMEGWWGGGGPSRQFSLWQDILLDKVWFSNGCLSTVWPGGLVSCDLGA